MVSYYRSLNRRVSRWLLARCKVSISFNIIVWLGETNIYCVINVLEELTFERLLRLLPILLIVGIQLLTVGIPLLRLRWFPWLIVRTRIVPAESPSVELRRLDGLLTITIMIIEDIFSRSWCFRKSSWYMSL